MSGLFVTFEGGDGSGKSTQLRLLATALQKRGHTVVQAREPGGTRLGQAIRELLLSREANVDARAEVLLFAADRAQNVATVVRPALANGSIVLQDRYVDSSLAYQGAGRVLDPGEVGQLSDWATDGLVPDLTVLLDLDPGVGKERIGEVDVHDRIEVEGHDFHQRVREAYLSLAAARPERYLVVDATLPISDVAAVIEKRVIGLLP